MEFLGNQIHGKTIFATLTVAFFLGRISLFGGTFPAAAAFITVMVAVSTVYIYLVPILAAAMLSVGGVNGDFYGDMMAMVFCGIFFLFFHRQRFSINQRTAVTVAAVVVCNCLYYAASHLLYLLDVKMLVQEALAVVVYIRVFNTTAKMVFVGKEQQGISAEKAGLALMILVVSCIGALEQAVLTGCLWILTVLIIQYCKGTEAALAAAAAEAVFCRCQGIAAADFFVSVMLATVLSWFLAGLVDGKYRKGILAMVMFLATAAFGTEMVFSAAPAAALFMAVPQNLLMKCWCAGEERLMPETVSEADLHLTAIKGDLRRKKQVFSALSKMYAGDMGSRQLVSCQFAGMARTVDGILRDLQGQGLQGRQRVRRQSVPVGEASYAFDAISGDSSLSFSFGKNKQAIVISDGMGKGSLAAAESKMVVTTLSQLLEAGFDVDLAVKTVNGILMTESSGDMFATVDLAIIDQETGRTQIYKMGAASTFVKHEGKVAMLKRPAPPAGIVDGLRLEYIDVRLKKGDLLIMVSDGVTDCDRKDPECQWLRERLGQIGTRDPGTVAELIVNKAAEKYGLRERDDLTVMVAAL